MDVFGLDIQTMALLVSGALTVSTSLLGGKLSKLYKIFKQLVDMVEDGNVSKEELQKFVKRVKNL